MGKAPPQEEREAVWIRPELKRMIRVIAALHDQNLNQIADEMAEAYIASKQIPVAIEHSSREEVA
jgi:hypothetical protein